MILNEFMLNCEKKYLLIKFINKNASWGPQLWSIAHDILHLKYFICDILCFSQF